MPIKSSPFEPLPIFSISKLNSLFTLLIHQWVLVVLFLTHISFKNPPKTCLSQRINFTILIKIFQNFVNIHTFRFNLYVDFSFKNVFCQEKMDCHITTFPNRRVLSWLNICMDVWTKLVDPHPLGMWMWTSGCLKWLIIFLLLCLRILNS